MPGMCGDVDSRPLHDDIRLNLPAFRPVNRWWRVFRVTFHSAGVCPFNDRIYFASRERAVVQEMPELRISKPRRHHSCLDGSLNCGRPSPGILIGEKRHWCDLAGTMASLT